MDSENGLIRHFHKLLALALQQHAAQLNESELDILIDALLNGQTHGLLPHFQSAKLMVMEMFTEYGQEHLQEHVDELLLCVEPTLTRVPLQVGSWLFTSVTVNEKRVKVVFEESAEPGKVCDAVAEATDNSNETRQIVQCVIGERPYVSLLLRTATKKYPKVDGDKVGETTEEESELTQVATGTHEGHTKHSKAAGRQEHDDMCRDCFHMRQEVQEDMLSALARATSTLKKQNFDMVQETCN